LTRVLRSADAIVAVSEFTKSEVVELARVPAERIRVVPNGVDAVFSGQGERAEGDYVLAVATLEPRKNLQVLVDAQRLLGDDLLLAVVGAEGWGEQPLLDGPGIRRLGFVSDEELARLYRGAAVVAYPSRFEGFGIPIVEAMACGAPVVSSAHPSLDEASGAAALRADPEDPSAFAAAIERAVAERERLVALGLEHVHAFSWRSVGETFLGGYEEART
jgi:glycosyltransferase involved in cell wall biosynthesis